MKNPFRRRKQEESPEDGSGRAKLGGICFVLGEDGEKHTVSTKDMPEDIRAYFEELGNQMRDEGGVIEMEHDNLPDYVSDYMAEQVLRAIGENPEALRIGDLPDELVMNAMEGTIDNTARRYKEHFPDCAENIDTCKGTLKAIFQTILKFDEDWQGLTVEEAGKLYSGIVMALITTTIEATRMDTEDGRGGEDDEEEDA